MDWKAVRRAAHTGTLGLFSGFLSFDGDTSGLANPQHKKGHKARKKRERQNKRLGRNQAKR